MNESEALYRLRKLPKDDAHAAHIEADEILVQFLRDNGFNEVADAFDKAKDGIGFWYE